MSVSQRDGKRAAVLAAAVASIVALWNASPAQGGTFAGNATGSGTGTFTHSWDNPAFWTTSDEAGEYPGQDDTTDIATVNFLESPDAAGDSTINLNLNGGTFTLDTLNMTEGAGNADGNVANGTLNVSNINYNTGSRSFDFESATTGSLLGQANVNGGAGLLTITNNGNRLNFLGGVQGTGGLSLIGSQQVDFRQPTFTLTGALTVDKTGITRMIDLAPGTFVPFDSITVSNIGKLEIDRGSGSGAYGLRSTGNTTLNSARLYVRANDDDGTLDIDGNLVLSNGGSPVEILFEQQRMIVNVDGALTENEGPTVLNLTANRNDSRLTLNATSTRTGTTNVNSAMVEIKAPSALGTGAVTIGNGSNVVGRLSLQSDAALGAAATVGANGSLEVVTAQTVFPQVTVQAFGALSGNTTNATFGAGGTVTFEADAIYAGNVEPTRADLGGAALLYRGITVNNQVQSVGDDGVASTYRGVAFGTFTPGGDFFGDVTSVNNEPLRIYLQTSKAIGPNGDAVGAEIPSLNPANDVVEVRGPGNLTLNSRDANNAFDTTSPTLTINRFGSPSLQNTDILSLDTNGSIQADPGVAIPVNVTVNVTDGRVRNFDVTDNVAGTLNINSGASLFLDNTVIATGTFNVGAGGAVYVNTANKFNLLDVNPATAGAPNSITFAPGSILVLDGDMDTAAGKIPQTAHIILDDENADLFTGNGIVLGQGARLASPSNRSVDLDAAGAGVHAAAGATAVGISSSGGDTFVINDEVLLDGVALTTNSATPFTTTQTGANMARVTEVQNGNLVFRGQFRAASVSAQGGQTVFDTADTNVSGDIHVAGGVAYFGGGGSSNNAAALTPRLVSTTGNVADRVADRIVVGAGTRIEVGLRFDAPTAANGQVEVTQPLFIDGPSPADERRIWVSRKGTTANDLALPVTFKNVTLGNNAGFGIDEDTNTNTKVAARANLALSGSASLYEIDDWDIEDLVRGPAMPAFDGSNYAVVTMGPINGATTTGVLNSNVYGTVGEGVRVNIQSGQLFFQDRSRLDGIVDTTASTNAVGDSWVQIRGGQTGDPTARVTGTGTIIVGASPDGPEDINIYANDPGTVGAPAIENVLGVLVEVVNDGNNTNNDAVLRATLNGTDVAGTNGAGIYGNLLLRNGARATFESNTGANPTFHNLTVEAEAIMSLDGTLGDSRPHSLRGEGRINTGDTGGTGAGGRETLIVGTNGGSGNVIAPGDSIGTLSVESLRLEDGFTLQFEGSATEGDLLNVLDTDGFEISGGLASAASVATTLVGPGASLPSEYVLVSWAGADPIDTGGADAVLSGWDVTGDITGTVTYQPSLNQIVLSDPTAVPEPATLGTLALAAAAAMVGRRRRRR